MFTPEALCIHGDRELVAGSIEPTFMVTWLWYKDGMARVWTRGFDGRFDIDFLASFVRECLSCSNPTNDIYEAREVVEEHGD